MRQCIFDRNSHWYRAFTGAAFVAIAFAGCAPTDTSVIERTQATHLAITDPAAVGVWQERTTLDQVRGAAIAFDRARSKIVLFGGIRKNGGFLNDTWEWNANEMRWLHQHPSDQPSARAYTAMAFDESRKKIVLFSGIGNNDVSDTWEWDGANWNEIQATTPPAARQRHQMAFDPSTNGVLLFGGYSLGGMNVLGDTWSWNGDSWTQLANGTPYDSAAMAFDRANNQVVRFGGNDTSFDPTNTTAVWDKDSWITQNPQIMPPPREGAVLSEALNALMLFGGTDINNNALDDTWSWDGVTWSLLPMAIRPPARSESAMAWDGKHVVLAGGVDNNYEDLGDTWLWDGSWSKSAASNPPAIRHHAMTYDETRHRVVLFGGYDANNKISAETWEWNGDWQQMTPAHSPPPRNQHVMTYDLERKVTVLFGGRTLSKEIGDTWLWDGTDWVQVSPQHSPTARYLATMAYDHERRHTILHGGTDDNNTIGDETWVWDGEDWTQLAANGPGIRVRHALVDHRARKELVLFSGFKGAPSSSIINNETWIWNGTSWSSRTPSHVPKPRAHHVMTYDPFRQRVILFGGELPGAETFDDVWEWDGTDWFQMTAPGGPPPASRGAAAFVETERGALYFGGEAHPFPQHKLTNATWLYKARGGKCDSDAQCDTHHCLIEPGETIGVCCEVASCGECQRCDTPKDPGRCAVAQGISCDEPIYCGDGTAKYSACDGAGVCVPKPECTAYTCTSGSDCPVGFRCRYDERCVPDEPYAPPYSALCMFLPTGSKTPDGPGPLAMTVALLVAAFRRRTRN